MILTESQKKAAQHLSTNILVSAGAGTGKTRVLVERILHILKTQKAGITEILVLTFTEKAANEIKGRLSEELRELGLEWTRRELEQASISTFHGFASRFLKEHPVEAAVDPDFRVLESEQADFLKDEALTGVIEKNFQENKEAFELFRVYGENSVRTGLLKVLTAARHEGKTLQEFFDENRRKREALIEKAGREIPREIRGITGKLDGAVDPEGLEGFLEKKDWEWRTVDEFRAWCGPSMRGGKRALAAEWGRWRELVKEFTVLKMEAIAAPWHSKFEALALEFEEAYETEKKEESFLDFDDLQIKAVRLFESDRPALRKLTERTRKKFRYILVDEFQDTNFLQTHFVERLSSGSNVFVVGDFKQSIYSFRGAEPRIFLDRKEQYRDGKEGLCMELVDNFRSSPPLLEFLNRFFKELWEEDRFPFGALLPKAAPVEKGAGSSPVEILVTNAGEGEGKERARMREALAIAGRIRELHEKEGVPYGDIAVLFQAMTLSGIYEHAMKSFEVPYFIMAGRGFYHQPEIQDLVSFLTHLEKPLLDIPLAATLRSPFFHMTDSTLFWLARRVKEKDETAPLIHALKESEKIAEISAAQKEILRDFMSLAEELRRLKDRVPLAELIDTVLDRTGYELAVLADRGGARRYANLKKLLAIVREYETYERMPLAKFLASLKRLQVQEVRESEAQVAIEKGSETVRMMTVHAAKGLEFPVVFVADMGHEGSRSDSKAVIAHANEGYALRLVHGAGKKEERPCYFQRIDREIRAREDEEWKRLFYVACTRAKLWLFLSGVYEKKKDPKEHYRDMNTWMDWAVAIGEKFGIPIVRDFDRTLEFRGGKGDGVREKMKAVLDGMIAEVPQGEAIEDAEVMRPVPRSIDLPASAYVLFQKDPQAFWRTYQIGWPVSGEDFKDVPEDLEEEKVSAPDFGTAMHTFLERLDIKDPERYLEQDALERIFGGFGNAAVREARELLKGFFGSPLFKELQRAKQVRREVSFVLNERHGLIHGKLDMLFQDEKGEWHILDYKTAVGNEEAAKKSAYDLQIKIYALAAHKILHMPVRSGMIHYLKNQKTVMIPFAPGAPAAFFEEIEKEVCDLQERILDYSNERICGKSRNAEMAL